MLDRIADSIFGGFRFAIRRNDANHLDFRISILYFTETW